MHPRKTIRDFLGFATSAYLVRMLLMATTACVVAGFLLFATAFLYVADVLEARAKKQNSWAKWYERLSAFCDRRFGKDWRDQDPDFWDHLIKY